MRDLVREMRLQATAELDRSDETVCVLVNDGSGNGDTGEARKRIAAAFARHGWRPELRITEGAHLVEDARQAVEEGFGTVVAAGGDGTISGVAGALAETGVTLGVLPLGTFNFVARGMGIPEEIDAAVRCVVEGARQPVTLGEVNGHVFLNNASLGLYPHILAEREGTYKRWGRSRIAAHWSVLKSFLKFRAPLRMKVRVDGKERRRKTPLAFLGRSAFQLEHFRLEGAQMIRDGKFALFLAPDSSRWKLFARALRLAGKGMDRDRDFELVGGREIVIETHDKTQSVAMDGERVELHGPFRFRLHDDWLDVIVPPGRNAAH